MTFMTLNGLAIPVKDATPRKTDAEFGGSTDRSAGGEFMSPQPRAIKRAWDCVTRPLLGRTAEELEAWITGSGIWHVSFDEGFQGDYGITPEAGHKGLVYSGAVAFAGGASLQLNTTPGGMGWVIPRASSETAGARNWTIAAWFSLHAGAFQHLAITKRNGSVLYYIDGVADPGPISNMAVADTAEGLLMSVLAKDVDGTNDSIVVWDDLIMANWPMNADMIAAIFARAVKFSAAPTMDLEGDIVRQAEVVPVRGVLQQGDYNQGRDVDDSTWQNNMRSLSFRLEER